MIFWRSLVICFLISLKTFGQTDPDGNQRLLKELRHDYDTVIAYTKLCTWQEPFLKIVCVKGNDLRILSGVIDSLDSSSVTRSDFDDVWRLWNSNGFWTLGFDSLNIRCYSTEAGVTTCLNTSDGCHEIIEFMNGDFSKTIATYEVDWFQSQIKVGQRDVFILCRNRFLSLFD